MTETEQKYNLKKVIQDIEDYLYSNDNNLNQTDRNTINKILFKLRNIDVIIENIDEDLINEIIDNDYNNLETYCNNFTSGNNNYISNLSSSTDSIINKIIIYIDFNMLLSNNSGIKRYVRAYKSEITRQNKILSIEVEDLLNTIQEKKNSIEDKESMLNNKIEELKNTFDLISKNQEELKNNIDNLLEESKKNVDISIESEQTKLDELYESKEQEFEKNFNELSENYKSKFNELLKELTLKDEKVSKLIGIVGEKARIGEYKRNADSSHKERIIWQVLTVILFIIAFILMLYVTITSKDYNKFTIFKYIISAILMGASTYTAKQASNSRKDEVYYRKQELELASIDVYLESMEPANREEIKKNLSTKMFGQAQNTYTNKYDDKKGFSSDDVVKIIESIKNLVK